MTSIAPHLTAFLRERLPVERGASRHTCDSYAYGFMLLMNFANERLGIPPSRLQLEQFDSPLIVDFLAHLQSERGNKPRTRNVRLAAIKSFMRFVQHRVPAALDQINRILAIPNQRYDTYVIRHLAAEEYQAILDAPDPTTRFGVRDRAMLHVAVTAGLRASELVAVETANMAFGSRYVDIYVQGKGRKQRVLKLWKSVADSLRAWAAIRGQATTPEFFLNARGEAMTRSGFKHLLAKHVAAASVKVPSLRSKKVSPHVLRHTCAMNVLGATGDIRKVALWLGHSNLQTTEAYLQVDPAEKIDVLDSMTPPSLRPGTFHPPDRLIEMLKPGAQGSATSTIMRR